MWVRVVPVLDVVVRVAFFGVGFFSGSVFLAVYFDWTLDPEGLALWICLEADFLTAEADPDVAFETEDTALAFGPLSFVLESSLL